MTRHYDVASVAKRAVKSLRGSEVVGTKTVPVPDLEEGFRFNDARAYCIHVAYDHLVDKDALTKEHDEWEKDDRRRKMRVEEVQIILNMGPTTFKRWREGQVAINGKTVTIDEYMRGKRIGYKERDVDGKRRKVGEAGFSLDAGGNRKDAVGYDLHKVGEVVKTVAPKLWQNIQDIRNRPLPKSGTKTHPRIETPEQAQKRKVLAIVKKTWNEAIDLQKRLKDDQERINRSQGKVANLIRASEEIQLLLGDLETLADAANQPGCYMTTLTLSEAIQMRWADETERQKAIRLYNKIMLGASKKALKAAAVAKQATPGS